MNLFRKEPKDNQIRIKRGDDKIFVSLYDQYASSIYRFIYLRTNSSRDSEDLASDVFLRFWRMLNKEPEQEQNKNVLAASSEEITIRNPRALLYQIARNLVADFYRKKAHREIIVGKEDDIFKDIPDSGDLKEKTMLASEMSQIKKALGKINGEYQEILIWHYLDDFSIKEIAQILQVPENRLRVKLHRALKSLKEKVK